MIALIKLSPVILLGILASKIGFGLDMLIAAPLALVYAILVGMFIGKIKFNDLMDSAIENLKHILIYQTLHYNSCIDFVELN